jgi:tetratricopeptide (TPR) repeat protein
MRVLGVTASVIALAATLLGWEGISRRQRYWRNVAVISELLKQCEIALEADDGAQASIALADATSRIGEGAPSSLYARLTRCRRDVDLFTKLTDIDDRRWMVVNGELPPKEDVNKLYAAVFDEQGVPLTKTQPGSFTQWVTGSKIAARLVFTLDLLLVRESRSSTTIFALLDAVDRDPYRRKLRMAILNRDRTAFDGLIDVDAVLAQPPFFLIALAESRMVSPEREHEILIHAWEQRPANYNLLMTLGTSHSSTHRIDSSTEDYARIAFFRAAVTQRPKSVAAWNDLASALLNVGENKDGLDASLIAAGIDHTDPLPVVNTAIAFLKADDLARAKEWALKSVKLDPNRAETHGALGMVYCDGTHDYKAAIAEFKEAIRLDPDEEKLHLNLGNALRGDGDQEGAIAAYRDAVRLNPGFARAHFFLATLLFERGNREGSATALRNAAATSENDEYVKANLWMLLRARGDLDGAEAACRKYLDEHPNSAVGLSNLGAVLYDKENYTGAANAFREAIRIEPEFSSAHFNLGNALRSLDDREGAKREYQLAVRLAPKYTVAHYQLGLLFAEEEAWTDSVAALAEAARLAPENVEIGISLAAAMANGGDVGGGVARMRDLVREHPRDSAAQNALAVLLHSSGDTDAGLQAIEEALKNLPEDALLYYNRSEFFYSKKDYAACIDASRMAIRLDPKLAPAYNNLGLAQLNLKNQDEAEKAFRKSIDVDPTYAKAYLNLGNVLYAKADKRGAVTAYQSAVQHDGHYLKAHYNLSVALCDVGDLDAALIAAERAIEIAPNDSTLLGHRERVLKLIEERKSSKSVTEGPR